MKKIEHGFSHIEGFLVVLVLVVIGGVGYSVIHRSHKVNSETSKPAVTTPVSSTTQTTPAAQPLSTVGTTQGIDSLTAQDAGSESSIDSKHSNSDQTTTQSANGAASNVGGAYNESSI
jgi:hypothetical protein